MKKLKTIKRSEIVKMKFWSVLGKGVLLLVGLTLYFAIAGYIVGFTEKRVYVEACRQVVIEACENTSGCIIKISK